MSERKAAVINVSKGLLDVSLAVLGAIAGAAGNPPAAGVVALVQAALASDILKPLLERKQEEHLELPLPHWWTEEPQFQSWQAVCSSIEGNLPAILKGFEKSLRKETSYPSSDTFKWLFIEQVAQHLSNWEVKKQDCYMVAVYVTPPLLEKTINVLKAAIDTTRQDILAQWLVQITNTLDMIQRATAMTPPSSLAAPGASAAPTVRDLTSQNSQAMVIRLVSKMQDGAYDVYICYEEEDEAEVMKIGEQLKARGILPWFDGVDVRPGAPKRLQQEEQIQKIPAAAVFIGQHAIAREQLLQIYAFIEQYIDHECAVIPVLLADATKKPELPPYLGNFGWVDFRKQVPVPLKQLIWGITGERL